MWLAVAVAGHDCHAPIDLLAVFKGQLLECEGDCQDAAGGSAADEIKQLVDGAPRSLLQLPQLPHYRNALRGRTQQGSGTRN